LIWSIACTLVALFLFGYITGGFTGSHRIRSAFQTMLIGGIAASAAFAIARLVA
jgi:VIT1/CCC1 family predicted Fe2+/Mn2+ transporter